MSAAAAPERGSNFYLGFLFLPKRKREALAAVYAYCRHVDDIVDSGTLPPAEAEAQLQSWREEVARLYEGGEPVHPIARRLAPFIREFRLPREGFDEMIRGCAMDLEKNRYQDYAELESYMAGVAGAVGLLCVEIFGHPHTPPAEARAYALTMGRAFQLTNILRDVGADLENGRIYLPLADMRAAGVSLDSFIRREHTPAFTALMRTYYAKAKESYSRARNLLDPRDRPAMAPAEAMAQIYEAVLEEVREGGFRVFFHRASLPAWRKAALALKAWAYSRGLY